MADLIDSAAGEMQQAGSQLTRAGVRTSVAIAAGTTRVSARIGARAVGGTVRGLVALLDAVRQATRSRSQEGELSLRQFTRVVDGKREVVPIKDAEVARQLARELRRHGVTFAIERNADGSRTFHVQGKDAALIEHALTQASIRVDERIMRARERAGAEPETQDVSLTQEPGSRVIELDDAQKATLVDALRESGKEQENAGADELAEQIERDGGVTLTEENVTAIDTALTGGHELPEHMGDVAAAVDEEKVAIAATAGAVEDITLDQDAPAAELVEAEAPEATVSLVLSGKERDTLVSQVQSTVEKERGMIAATAEQQQEFSYLPQLAESIESTGQVELTPLNVERLHTVFADHDWTPGVDGDKTPEHMRWIVDAVAEEHQVLEERTVDPQQQTQDVDRSAGERENPYLRDDLPAQTVPAAAVDGSPFGADEWDAPAEVRTERVEDTALVPDAATKDAPQKPAPAADQQRPATQATTRERELSPRDATRERVAKKIDAKVTDMKEQQQSATRPTSRAPQRTQADEPRAPQTRR